MATIPFVEAKLPDMAFVEAALEASRTSGLWSNFGPVSRRLEAQLERQLRLPPTRRVVACASGMAGLEALVGLHTFRRGRPLRWAVSAFTFACQRQGRLAEARVVDCGPDGHLRPDDVDALGPDAIDGVVVTNLFGGATDVAAWQAWAAAHDKRLLFDSAPCFGATYQGTPLGAFGDGELFSFHHTKPCGFGEAGAVVVPAEDEVTVRSLLNFGRYGGVDTGALSGNGKLSDVAAAFVLDRLRSRDRILGAHRAQWRRVVDLARPLGYGLVGAAAPDAPNLVALRAPVEVPEAALEGRPVRLHKLYRPLDAEAATAADLYRRVVCVPCHEGLADLPDRELSGMLEALLSP